MKDVSVMQSQNRLTRKPAPTLPQVLSVSCVALGVGFHDVDLCVTVITYGGYVSGVALITFAWEDCVRLLSPSACSCSCSSARISSCRRCCTRRWTATTCTAPSSGGTPGEDLVLLVVRVLRLEDVLVLLVVQGEKCLGEVGECFACEISFTSPFCLSSHYVRKSL